MKSNQNRSSLLAVSLFLIVFAVLVLPLSVLALASVFTALPAILTYNNQGRMPVTVALRGASGAALQRLGFSALQASDGDQLVLGGVFELPEGQTLAGSLVVIGGVATLQSGSQVEEDVVLLGGTLRSDGTIQGDVISIGGLVDLGEESIVQGDVNILSGHLQRAEGARIQGRVNQSWSGPYYIPLVTPTTRVLIPGVNGSGVLWQALYVLFRSFLWAIVALLVVLLLPNHSERVRKVIVETPLVAAGLGLLTVIVAPIVLVVITITIIGIPLSLAALFVLALAWAFGVIVLGLEVGKRLVQAARLEWAPAVAAGLGAFLVTLVANTIGVLVPCIGWMMPAAVGMLGLGAVLMTRFGSQDHQPGGLRSVVATAVIDAPPSPDSAVDIAESTQE